MSGHVPCRFYAQGTCKFGNTCRFSHAMGQQQPPAYQHQQGFGGGSYQTHNQAAQSDPMRKIMENVQVIVNSMQQDMKEWESGKIWNFSSYGPIGGRPCIPGFEDLSEDELRLLMLQSGGALPPDFQQRLNQIQQLRLHYSNPTPEIQNMIKDLLTPASAATTGSAPQQHSTLSFGVQPQTQGTANTIFGGSSTFGSQATTGSIFGGGTGTATATAGSIFGGSGQSQSSGGTFGSGFGTTMQQPTAAPTGVAASIFGGGQQQQQPQPSSIFGGTPANSLFGSSSGTSVAPQQSQWGGTTGQVQGTPGAGIFGTTGSTLFAPQPQQQPSLSVLTPAQPQTVFGGGGGFAQQPQLQTQGFGIGTFGSASAAPAQPPVVVFGGGATTGPAPAFQQQLQQQRPGNPYLDAVAYSDESCLSPEDIAAYEADEFTDHIPIEPPPRRLCFP